MPNQPTLTEEDKALIGGIIALTRDREQMVKTFIANPRALFQSLTHLADEVERLSAAPTPGREEIARVIAPHAFALFDEVAAYQARPQNEAPWSDEWSARVSEAVMRTTEARVTADAILALFAIRRPGDGGTDG